MAAVLQGGRHIVQRQLEGVDGRIVHGIGRDDAIREGRFHFAGFGRRQRLGGNAAGAAHLGKIGDVSFVVTRHSDEKPTGVFNAVGRQFFQQQVFPAAFGGSRRVGRDIAGPAVQQAVIAARGAGIEILFFDQDAVNPAQGQITHQAGARDATADNKHLCIQDGPQ